MSNLKRAEIWQSIARSALLRIFFASTLNINRQRSLLPPTYSKGRPPANSTAFTVKASSHVKVRRLAKRLPPRQRFTISI